MMKSQGPTVILKRSRRKTLALEITRKGELIIRAPQRMPLSEIQAFVEKKQPWIEKHLLQIAQQNEDIPAEPLTQDEVCKLADQALRIIPERVKYYAPIVGVTYHNITIRNQKTKWGSCSSRKNLNFNCGLMLAPPEILDYVVVHELCHLKVMDHSPAFWQEVEQILPDYRKRKAWLKSNGSRIMRMLHG